MNPQALPPVILPHDEALYLAGLFDGEGTICVTVAAPRPPRRPSPKYELSVAITMLARPTINAFATWFGGSHYTDYRNGEHQSLARWYCGHGRAGRALTALEPYLRIKRRQAQLALQFLQTFHHPNEGRSVLPAPLLEERLRLSDEIARLNNSHWLRKRLAKRQPTEP